MRDRILGLKKTPITTIRGFSGGNPKQRTAVDREMLAGSLKNHGYVLPVAVRDLRDGTYELIDGHGRVEEIARSEPDATIKVLVLDVDSVADGRRILLALQHTAGWDVDRLEAFVRDGLAEGTDMAALMEDTGLTGKQLDAFAAQGTAELERMVASTGDGAADDRDDGEPRGPSRAGLNPEHVQFATPITREQSKAIAAAIKLAKQVHNVEVKGDALAKICEFYVERTRAERQAAKDASKATRPIRRRGAKPE